MLHPLPGRRSPPLPSALLILAISACNGDDSDGEPGRAGLPTTDLTDSVTLQTTIGAAASGEDAELFGSIGNVRLGPDGSIYVLDQMAGEIRRFSADGDPINTIGRRGSGPGEFQRPFRFDFSGDTLQVWDAVEWRISAFLPNGSLAWTAPVEPRRESGWLPHIARASTGDWLYLDQEITAPDEEGVSVERRIIRGTARLLSWSPESEKWRRVAEFPGMEAALIFSDGGPGLGNAPFPRGPLWTPGPQGSYWYADTDRYDVVRRSIVGGDTLARIEIALEGQRVTDDDWNDFVVGRQGDPSTAAARARRNLPRPDRKPVLGALLATEDGDLWVQLYEGPSTGDSTEWHVYTADGDPRFALRLPGSLDIRSVTGDTIFAVARDSMDVQRVQVLTICD